MSVRARGFLLLDSRPYICRQSNGMCSISIKHQSDCLWFSRNFEVFYRAESLAAFFSSVYCRIVLKLSWVMWFLRDVTWSRLNELLCLGLSLATHVQTIFVFLGLWASFVQNFKSVLYQVELFCLFVEVHKRQNKNSFVIINFNFWVLMLFRMKL